MRTLRRFRLVRNEDETGVSGTGVVGVGCEMPDGCAVFMWTNDSNSDGPDTNENSVYVYPGGMHDIHEVHGHSGKTEVVWIDSGKPRCSGLTDESKNPSPYGEDAECPVCGGPPITPYQVQFDGPGIELVCLNDHRFVFYSETGECVET